MIEKRLIRHIPLKQSIKITVEGNYVNLDDYGALLVGKKTKVNAPDIKTEKAVKAFFPYITEIVDKSDDLELTFLISGYSHDGIWKKFRKLSNLLRTCTIEFGSEDYLYECILKDYDHNFLSWNELEMTVSFETMCFSHEMTYNVSNGYGMYTIDGAKETPINYSIVAKENVVNVKLNDITIKNMKKNDVLTIDGLKCQVKLNGENAIDDVIIYEFERALGKHVVTYDNLDLDVKMSYRARW